MKKYEEGTFGYWWTIIEGKEDIEGKTYCGDINCSCNNLTSLEGAPEIVEGDFYCSFNNLTSLEGAPEKVSGGFCCSGNGKLSIEEIQKYLKKIKKLLDN